MPLFNAVHRSYKIVVSATLSDTDSDRDMLQQISGHIKECHARAEEARRHAAETSDPERRTDYELAEQGWLGLADSYALSERLERYLLEQDSKIAHRGEWQAVSDAPFGRDIEIAVIKSATPHAVAFPCRRILGGWMDSQSRERLNVQPTHWRDWVNSRTPRAAQARAGAARLANDTGNDDVRPPKIPLGRE